MKDSQLNNLIPFQKGKSGNPKGRPKGSLNISTLLDKVMNKRIELDDPLIGKKKRKKIIEHGIERQAVRWLNGDNMAGKDLLDRLYGKALDNKKIEHSGKMIDLDNYTLEELDEALKKYEIVIKKADESE